jgi:transcriptional regulator with XRE-family HTH domain
MYYDKLKAFFKKEGLNQKQVAEILGYSESMIGRYLKGTAKFDTDFIMVLTREFPKIDLQSIFVKEPNNDASTVEEPKAHYILTDKQVIKELQTIEDRIADLKKSLMLNNKV